MKAKSIIVLTLVAILAIGICGCSCSSKTSSGKTSEDVEYKPLDYVTLGQYEGVAITLNKADYEVTDDKINDKMREMVGSDTTFEADPDKKVVKPDSIVNVNYVGKKDGVAFDGGTAENVWIDVAKNSDAERGTKYIDGFSNGIVGARVGTTAEYGVTFPQNYSSAELAGQYVTFEFTINSIAKDKNADFTDAYVKEHSDYNSVAELREAATAELTKELAEQKDSDTEKKVSEAVIANCTVKSLPEDVVDRKVDEYMKYYEKRYASNGYTLEQVIQTRYGMSIDEFKQQVKAEFEADFKNQIVFEAIAQAQGMTVDEAGFNAYVNQLMTSNGFDSLEKLYQYQGASDDPKVGESYLKKIYLCNKALDYCVSKAVINEQ